MSTVPLRHVLSGAEFEIYVYKHAAALLNTCQDVLMYVYQCIVMYMYAVDCSEQCKGKALTLSHAHLHVG